MVTGCYAQRAPQDLAGLPGVSLVVGAADRAGVAGVNFEIIEDTVQLENSFVTSVGWVKPGDTYPWRVFVRNYTGSPITNAEVSIPAPPGTSFTQATPLTGSGTAPVPAWFMSHPKVDDRIAAIEANEAKWGIGAR